MNLSCEINDINRLVAFGCSVTAGMETADHMFLKDKNFADSLDDLKKTHGQSVFYQRYIDQSRYSDMLATQKSLSWVRWTADLLDIPYLNLAQGGNSISAVVYNLEDFIQNQMRSDDLMIVGIPPLGRYMLIDNCHVARSVQLNDQDWWPSSELHEQMLLHCASDDNLLWQWYQSIKYIDMLSDRLQGRIVMFYTYESISSYLRYMKPGESVRRMVDDNNLHHAFNLRFYDLIDHKNPQHVHGLMHPTVSKQREFASILYYKLIEANT